MFGFGLSREGAMGGRLNCIVGEESSFRGDIDVKGSVRIDGEFEGHIIATESLLIGKSGVVKADVEVRDLMVAGFIVGNLKAAERVELHAGARVDGDIETASFMVEDGVVFNGKCLMHEAEHETSVRAAS